MPFSDPASAGSGLLWALLLASAACAGLAYALGVARAQRALQETLREARQALRDNEQLLTGWRWQTDSAHRLLHWSGPGRAPQADCPLFRLPAVLGPLHSQQAFDQLRVNAASAVDGSQGWVLQGVPQFDASGGFQGFRGLARSADDEDKLRLQASLAESALAALPGPAFVLRPCEAGWAWHQANEAARQLWPAGNPGQPMAEARGALPSALVDALCNPASAGEIEGWHLTPLPGTPAAAMLLARPAAAEAPAASGTAAPQGAVADERDNFSFTLSHDLRAPIRVVDGFTRIVKEDYGRLLDRVGNDHLDRVLAAAARMNHMIDALLGLAQLSQQPLARQPVNLSQLAGYVVDDLRRSAPEREASFEIAPSLAANGDPTLLRLVLENLLGNAWKYSGKAPQARIALHATVHDGKPAFVVKDNGAGFDMRSADRLFGLFQRLHSASDFPGHGVGLASVRRIIQRHGGQIWADSEPGRGAAFYFTLPD